MKKKISAIIMAVVLTLSFATSCRFIGNNNSGSDGGSSSGSGDDGSSSTVVSDTVVDVTDDDVHLVSEEKRLHEKTVTEAGRTFCANGETEYAIVVGTDSSSALEAAAFLATQIENCTGASITTYFDTDQDMIVDNTTVALEYSANAKYIVYSHEAMEEAAGVTWKSGVDLAYSGYMLKTVGDSVFLKVNSLYGYQTASQAFCREVLGYEWYSEDTIVYTKTGATLPNMDIVEKPDFDLVDRSGYISRAGAIASGMTKETIFTYINGQFCHNSFDYLPPKSYNNNDENGHYKWYASNSSDGYNANATQLCYSARGDQAEYDVMLTTAFEAVMETLDRWPNSAALTFTRQDEYGNCECPVCSAMKSEYGSLTATYMLFVNDLDDLVQAELQRRADESGEAKREVTLLFFAYRETCEAPVKGTDGNYEVPKASVTTVDGERRNTVSANGETVTLPYHKTYENGLHCNEHVGVFYAPIDATYEESFYHLENKEYKTNFEKWSLVSDRLYGWIYDTNFVHWLVPYNSFDSIAETLRFLKDNNCQYVFNQAQGGNTVCTGFGSLKTYLNLTLARDVNLNSGELIDKFFANYFQDAAEPMREYYESLVGHMQKLEEEYPEVFYTQRRTESESTKYWPLATLQSWLSLCDKAYEAIEKYKTSDPELYKTLEKHIKIETLFPRFMICEYYSGFYTSADIQAERQSFYDDCQELSYQYYAENVPISTWFTKWGVA